MNLSSGISNIKIGLIDGPVKMNHPDLNTKNICELQGNISGSCSNANSIACSHGTMVAGILFAKRGSNAPSICPGCSLLVRPIFNDAGKIPGMPSATPEQLAAAITECVQAKANIINLSAAIVHGSQKSEDRLIEALDLAAQKGVIVVAAAGNQGIIGSTIITRHPWVIPVAACNQNGIPLPFSNFSAIIGKQGILAPGDNITTLGSDGKEKIFNGTSAATPFVTGALALLWSAFPELHATTIKHALVSSNNKKRAIIPSLMNAALALDYIKLNYSKKTRA
jgi:subtilisin family serine protease